MLKIEYSEPWVMWVDSVVDNFVKFPANKIFDYEGDYQFNITFELTEPVLNKSTLFAKLPSYFGIDIEQYGLLFLVTDNNRNTNYIFIDYVWQVGIKFELTIEKEQNQIKILINGSLLHVHTLTDVPPKDDISHIIFGAGNFPKNGFNLNYFSFIIHDLSIYIDKSLISQHNFVKFIHNKSYDLSNNCNFIHKII